MTINQDSISTKAIAGERISDDEALYLFENAELSSLSSLANTLREARHGNTTYFNRNFHIEPTNLCVFTCKFCAYSRKIKQKDEGWVMSNEQILHILDSYKDKPVTEVHIVGGVLPQLTLTWFCDLLEEIKARRPEIHIKGFTAVELEYMIRKAKMPYKEGLAKLQNSGLDSLPGGGAEIFHPDVRNAICADKCSTEQWLEIHKSAHELGMRSNATMLYGHIEKYEHRVHHMRLLRELQDETQGFQTFIPLKFRSGNNEMTELGESSIIDDLKTYAIARIYLENFKHIKAYWPMIGRKNAQILLDYGVNDLDGTIDDSTKIYSMAGAEEQNPALSTNQIVELIQAVGRKPVERDTFYNHLQEFEQV